MSDLPEAVAMEVEVQRSLAADLFNYCWDLIEKPDRTARETEMMIGAAHASRFFWEAVGEPVNHARGEWQISRAYAVAGRPEPALHHAQHCLEICEANQIKGLDLAYAYEALARASEGEKAAAHASRARAIAASIEDDEDRDQLLEDLASIA